MPRMPNIVPLSAGFGIRSSDADHEFMSRSELATFRTFLDAGKYSRFKTWECGRAGCLIIIPKSKEFCSKSCCEAQREADMRTAVVWNIDLTALLKRTVAIETHDGTRLTGRLTKVNFRAMVLDGHDIEVPDTIELDGDNTMPFSGLTSIKRLPKR